MIKQSNIVSIPENIEAPLWRYMSIEKMESLLKESALYFRRADLFEDSLEGKQSKATLDYRPKFFEGAKDTWINKTMPMMDARVRKCVYVNCWHNNKSESKYMWDSYTEGNKGIAIKSSLNRIRGAILDKEMEFLLSPVRYIDYEKEYTSDANSFYAFFYKDKSYENEREFRFAFIQNWEHIDREDFDLRAFEEGIFVPVDNSLLIEKIIISPHTKNSDLIKIKKILKKYKVSRKMHFSKT